MPPKARRFHSGSRARLTCEPPRRAIPVPHHEGAVARAVPRLSTRSRSSIPPESPDGLGHDGARDVFDGRRLAGVDVSAPGGMTGRPQLGGGQQLLTTGLRRTADQQPELSTRADLQQPRPEPVPLSSFLTIWSAVFLAVRFLGGGRRGMPVIPSGRTPPTGSPTAWTAALLRRPPRTWPAPQRPARQPAGAAANCGPRSPPAPRSWTSSSQEPRPRAGPGAGRHQSRSW